MALTINHQTHDISATSGSVTLDGSAVVPEQAGFPDDISWPVKPV